MSADVCSELAHAFVERFNARTDDDGLYAPGATVWNNLTGADQPHTQTALATKALQSALADLRFEETSSAAWDDGFCVQYTLTATLDDGTVVRAPACGIASVADGRITRFQEYIDSAQAAPLGQALLAALAAQPAS